MPQKKGGGRKKAVSGKKRTTGGRKKAAGKGKAASKQPKKAAPKQSQTKQKTTKRTKQRRESNADGNGNGEGGGIGEKREMLGNVADEFRGGLSTDISKDNLQSLNPLTPNLPLNPNQQGATISKDLSNTQTQTQSQEHHPGPDGKAASKPKRIKDPAMIASKLKLLGIAAARSIQLSALIQPQTFMMNRFGATFLPPNNMASASGETKRSTDDSDTASTSGDED